MQEVEKLIDTALMYGFNTNAGFFKAFKREFGCSPTKFLKLNTAKKPIAVNLIRERKIMITQAQVRKLLLNWDIDTTSEISNTSDARSTVQQESYQRQIKSMAALRNGTNY